MEQVHQHHRRHPRAQCGAQRPETHAVDKDQIGRPGPQDVTDVLAGPRVGEKPHVGAQELHTGTDVRRRPRQGVRVGEEGESVTFDIGALARVPVDPGGCSPDGRLPAEVSCSTL